MPRITRGLIDGGVYHVLNRGNGKQVVFHKDGDYEAFLVLMGESKTRYPIELLAYCILPNHFHFVIRCPKAARLCQWMQWLMTSHVRRYHKHYGSSGHVWQGRFKSFLIQEDAYLFNVFRYVEANPFRAGLVLSSQLWPWSSLRHRIVNEENSLIDPSPFGLPDRWVEMLDVPQEGEVVEQIRNSLMRQTPYGQSDWQRVMSSRLGLESTLRPRGRPRKLKSSLSPFKGRP